MSDDILAQSEAEDTDNIKVALGSITIEVLPFKQWQTSAMSAANRSDFDAWAGGALTDESYRNWLDYGPRVHEAEAAVEEWSEAFGEGKDLSRAQRRQLQRSKSTRKN